MSPRTAARKTRSSSARAIASLADKIGTSCSRLAILTACSRAWPAVCHSAQARSSRTCRASASAPVRRTFAVRSALRSSPSAPARSRNGSGPERTLFVPKLKFGSGSKRAANACASATAARARKALRSGLAITAMVAMAFMSSGRARSMVAGRRKGRSIAAASRERFASVMASPSGRGV